MNSSDDTDRELPTTTSNKTIQIDKRANVTGRRASRNRSVSIVDVKNTSFNKDETQEEPYKMKKLRQIVSTQTYTALTHTHTTHSASHSYIIHAIHHTNTTMYTYRRCQRKNVMRTRLIPPLLPCIKREP